MILVTLIIMPCTNLFYPIHSFYLDGTLIMTVDPGTGFWDFGDLGSTGYQNPWVGGTKMAPFDKEVSNSSLLYHFITREIT